MALTNVQPHLLAERVIFSRVNPAVVTSYLYSNDSAKIAYTDGVVTYALDSVLTTGAVVTLAQGGTGANITAVNGAVVYCGASAMALTAAGTTGQILRSAGAASPTWSTATYPATIGAGALLYGSATNVIGGLAIGASGTFLKSNGTVPAWSDNGSSMINLDASNIALGTLADARLSAAGQDAITKRHTQNTDTGTTAATWVVGSGTDAGALDVVLQFGGTNPQKLTWDAQSGSAPRFTFGAVAVNAATFTGQKLTISGGALASSFTATTTAATSPYVGVEFNATDNYAGTVALLYTTRVNAPTKGGGTTITKAVSLRVEVPTAGSTNYAIETGGAAWFGGSVGINSAALNFELNIHSTGTGGRIAITNASTGSANTDGLHIALAALDAYIINNEAGAMYFRTSNANRISIDASGNIAMAVRVAVGTTTTPTSGAQLHITAATTTPFLNLIGAVDDTGSPEDAGNLTTINGDGDVQGPKDKVASPGWAYAGMFRIAIGGTTNWVPRYTYVP